MTPQHDPRAYLDTEARVIAEDDRRIVLALRIDKAAIARHMPLISAILDICLDRGEHAHAPTAPG